VASKIASKKYEEVNSVAIHMTHGEEIARATYQQHQGTKNSIKALESVKACWKEEAGITRQVSLLHY